MNYYNDIFCIETGDEPGNGRYLCVNCNSVVDIDDDHVKVPCCPCCEQELFYPRPQKHSAKQSAIPIADHYTVS